MAVERGNRPPVTWAGAAAILFVKAGLGLWAALVVLSSSPTRPQSFLGQPVSRRGTLIGLLLVALVAASVVVAVGLLRSRSRARLAAFVLEAVVVALSLSRLPTRPGPAYLSLALSGAVILLVLFPTRAADRPDEVPAVREDWPSEEPPVF